MVTRTFHDPLMLFLFIPLAAGILWYLGAGIYRRDSALAVTSPSMIPGKKSWKTRTRHLPVFFRIAALVMLIAAMARPGTSITTSSIKNRGIDIFIVLDVSESMSAEDFQPKNRLEVARQVVLDFVKRREHDRIGLVIFSGDAYLQAPLTVEKDIIQEIVAEINFESVTEKGTAIGDALALAASRLAESTATSKVILLLTDGVNNRGEIDPVTAATACKEKGIRVYSVGIGKEGRVPMPGGNPFMPRYMLNHIDETVLKKVSDMTGGAFYRATSAGLLWEKINDIDRLEKSSFEVKQYHEFQDHFQVFLAVAAALFCVEVLLRSLVYRKIP